jgi:hypothetical protein
MQNKIIHLGFFVVLSIHASKIFAQDNFPVPIKENSIYYEEVVKLDSLFKKDPLYQRTKLWVAQNFVTTGNFNPIQYEDRDNGVITIRIPLKQFESSFFIHTYYVNVTSVGTIQVKDGRYKYTFTDFMYSSQGDFTVSGKEVKEDGSGEELVQNALNGASKKLYLDYLNQINSQMTTIIESLKNALGKSISDDF